jgi:hypothetical protein
MDIGQWHSTGTLLGIGILDFMDIGSLGHLNLWKFGLLLTGGLMDMDLRGPVVPVPSCGGRYHP